MKSIEKNSKKKAPKFSKNRKNISQKRKTKHTQKKNIKILRKTQKNISLKKKKKT